MELLFGCSVHLKDDDTAMVTSHGEGTISLHGHGYGEGRGPWAVTATREKWLRIVQELADEHGIAATVNP